MLSAVVQTIFLIFCLTQSTFGQGRNTETELAAQISSLNNNMKTVEAESKFLMNKLKGADESFKAIETTTTVLSTQVSCLTKDMKAMERASLLLEVNVTRIHEMIGKGQENSESLKAMSTDMLESVNQLKHETNTMNTKLTFLEKTLLDEKNNSVDLAADLRNRLLELEEQQKTLASLEVVTTAITDTVRKMKEEQIEHTKDMFELPETADNTLTDEHTTYSGKFTEGEFSSWEQLTTKLVDGEAHKVLLYGLLAVILSQIYLQISIRISPAPSSQEESKSFQSMEEIAKSTLENRERNDQIGRKVDDLNILAARFDRISNQLEADIKHLKSGIITVREKSETLNGNLNKNISTTSSLLNTVGDHGTDIGSLQHDLEDLKSCAAKLKKTTASNQTAIKENVQTSERHSKKLEQSTSDITKLKMGVESVEATQKTYVAEEAFRKTEKSIKTQISTQGTAIRQKIETDAKMIIQHLTDVVNRRTSSLVEVPAPHFRGNTVGSMPAEVLSKYTAALERFTQTSSSSENEDAKAAKGKLSAAAAALDRYTLSSSSASDGAVTDIGEFPIVRPDVPAQAHIGNSSARSRESLDSGIKGIAEDEDDDEPVTCDADLG